MALPIVTHLSIGGKKITDFNNLVIQQSLFGHHHVSVEIPFDVLEGSGQGFLTSAHQDLVAQPITVSFSPAFASSGSPAAYTFSFKGLITHLEVGTQGDLTGSFSVQGFSPTYLLSDVPRYRTFRNQTLADIFRTVLAAYPGNALTSQLKPASTAPVRYVAQYGESDFVFLHRLAAQHGEWLYYDGTALCLGRPAGEALPFFADGVRAGCQLRFGVQPADTAVAQYQPASHQVLRADSSSQAVPWVGQHPLTAFAAKTSADLFPDAGVRSPTVALNTQTALTRYAAQVKSQQAARLVTCKGWGEDPNMTLGRVIDVSSKGLGTQTVARESFGKYLLTTVTHIIDQDNYHNVFEAVPWSAEHPPLNPAAQPPVGHPELAEVIDLKDPERLGRLRLRYPWQVPSPAQAETDWVRMTTPYSGDGKGQLFSPELGSQVLVGYEQNRAETPVILGNLVHGNNKQGTKYTPTDNHLKGLQTAGGNKLVMTDTKGEQTILISNSNNKATGITVSFRGDGSVHIQSKGPVTVNGSVITLDAGEKGEIKMHAKNITMVAEDDVKVTAKTKGISLKAQQDILAEATQKLQLKGDQGTSLTSPQTVDIGTGSTVNISASVVNQS
jgi:uncharacterized protein involved in type VI secretion and phage assembly